MNNYFDDFLKKGYSIQNVENIEFIYEMQNKLKK